MTPSEKQEQLVAMVQSLFTFEIESQVDAGDYINFRIPDNNFLQYDKIDLTGINENYNRTLVIHEVDGDTVTVAKAQAGFTLEYDSEANFSEAEAICIRVFNNLFIEAEQNDSTFVVVDLEDTFLKSTSVPVIAEQETMFPIMVIVAIDDFPIGDNQVFYARQRAYSRIIQVLEELECKIVGNLNRTETVFSSMEVTVIASIIEY